MVKPLNVNKEGLNAFLDDDFPVSLQTIAQISHQSLRQNVQDLLASMDPKIYAKTRNFLDGHTTHLSPYISSGFISITEVFEVVLSKAPFSESEKLISELMWRAYFRAFLTTHPHCLTTSFRRYATGYVEADYADGMPHDILEAKTPNVAINYFIQTLTATGYLHNHARMYVAAYVVHFRRVKWQVGAMWMFEHLIDADHASNHLSWQWVASTLTGKPYIFNLENVQKYAANVCDTSAAANPELVGTYEALHQRLFKGVTR